ncbi:head completion/stabilization protein [Lysobacter arvi]|uniref:Head completion/stabilization protein n=1 Tax=Lysobacter arvi TaxID=3038776 RepID=A0ABU1CB33_9GAMM|nr:head completion/stabilization protein [Lysobacter arvi]MDR0182399.1 head completion/stabilization protein [Lysobacter arvi]
MNGFVAIAPASKQDQVVRNDGWFPDVSLADVRAATRLDNTITDLRLRESVAAAIIEINDELADWAAAKQALGIARLEHADGAAAGGDLRSAVLYRRAVYSLVQADLREQYRDFDSTNSGQRRASEQTESADEARRNARWATAALLGRRHTTVDLI